ncbi:hypothetical protein GIB67_000419, partial [Kingdonia uniflora]
YTMNEKVPPTAFNRRKRELAREEDLVTYKKKRKTIDPSTVIPPNTIHSTNEGVSEGVNIPTESAAGINIPQGSEFETESAQAGLGAQPPLPNVCPNFDENILIFGGYSEDEGATSNDDVGPSDKSLLRSFRFHRARSIAQGQSWIFAHFPKLGGIPKEMDYDAYEHCTCWKWDVSVTDRYGGTALLNFREALDNYKLEDFNREQGIPTKRLLTEVSNLWNAKVARKFSPKYEWVDCFSSQKWKEFVLKKADRGRRVRDGPLVCTKAYLEWFASLSWTMICSITVDLAVDDYGIHQRKPASVNKHGDTPVHQSEDIVEQYDTSHHEHSSLSPNINLNDQQITALNDKLQKLKDDKEKESETNINLKEALKKKTSECDLLKETIEQMKAEIELKRVVDEQCALEFTDLPRQLDVKCKEIESLKMVNKILMKQIDMQLPLATPLTVLQSHQPVPDTTLAKKYEDLLVVHENVKKKLIAKEDFVSHSK